MKLTWLHVSDFHIRAGENYDRQVVLRALVRSVKEFHKQGRRPDVIFATGDIAQSGKAEEYEPATEFFDALIGAAGLERRRLFVVPGNHDVDRTQAIGLARTLESREQVDAYFAPGVPKPHLSQKLGAFRQWYDRYFEGIRSFPANTTCGPVEIVTVGDCRMAVLPLNTSLFCQDDEDHAKLLIGRRCLESAIEALGAADAQIKVALSHHPLEWLSDIERANVKTSVRSVVDVMLRGHLHETVVESIVSAGGGTLHVAAGATYQTRKWPQCAMYATIEDRRLRVFPIRYEDSPKEIWTIDPSVFPEEPGFEKSFAIPRFAQPAAEVGPPAAPVVQPAPAVMPRFRSNIPSRGDLPFVGREKLLEEMAGILSHTSQEQVLVLHGQPGVGKSEVAREFGRLHQQRRYPGGAFFIGCGGGAEVVDLARIGANMLGLQFPAGLSLKDQCERTLFSFGSEPVLLIYDNCSSLDAIRPWLPPSGMPCHVLITSVNDLWDPGLPTRLVEPLTPETSLELVEKVAGREVAARQGRSLVELSGGLPIQIVPASRTLAYEARHGRLEQAALNITSEASDSFHMVYQTLDSGVRLLLHAAAFLSNRHIVKGELYRHLEADCGRSVAEFERRLDVCLDLHLLERGDQHRMHQLFARFLLDTQVPEDLAAKLEQIRCAQRDRLKQLAKDVAAEPANGELAAALMTYPLDPAAWSGPRHGLSIEDGEWVGSALAEIGRFEEARPWYERAVEVKQKGDLDGRIDHESLGRSLHHVGFCLSSVGRFKEARPWYERAVKATEKGDVQGRIDHYSLGMGLHQIALCLSGVGKFEEARPWYERAVEAKQKGDVHGRIDHESLGTSLHQVGFSLSSVGRFEQARAWYERAVEAAQKGDLHGRIDHGSLGISLHQVGFCLSSTGEFEEARPWYERAVEAAQKGDVHGRVNHASLGISLHQVGLGLSSTGEFKEARPWYERAVEAKQKGDVHGRIDSESLGISLHQVGFCLSEVGKFEEARPWYERAVEAGQKGDVHGRIDYGSLGRSLHQVGLCLSKVGKFEEARPWYERAVEAGQKGDVHGRIDYGSLGRSVHQVGFCLSEVEKFEEARPWYERAVEAARKGDLHVRIDYGSLVNSLGALAHCLRRMDRVAEAEKLEKEASKLKNPRSRSRKRPAAKGPSPS